MFSVHTTREEFENAPITGDFGFVFEKNWGGKSRDYGVALFSKAPFVLRPQKNAKPTFSNYSGP